MRIDRLLYVLVSAGVYMGHANSEQDLAQTICLRTPVDHVIEDTIQFNKNDEVQDTISNVWNLVRLGQIPTLNGKRLYCYPNSIVIMSNDSILKLRTGIEPAFKSKYKILNFGIGIAFDADIYGQKGKLLELMNQQIDSMDARVMQNQFSMNYDFSIYKVLGFNYRNGVGGYFYVPTIGEKDDRISMSYEENSYGPYIELSPQLYFTKLPYFAFRYNYRWLNATLRLSGTKIKQGLIEYPNGSSVLIQPEGILHEFSFVFGSELTVQANLIYKSLNFEKKRIYEAANLGFVLGLRF